MSYSIISIGEPVIDFVEICGYDRFKKAYVSNAGGGAANVLAAAAAMGGKPAMIGRVGDDIFGEYLISSLRRAGIDTAGIKRDASKPTGIGFVYHRDNGERDFLFYRDRTTNVTLYDHEAEKSIVEDCRIYHYTSVSLTSPSLRADTLAARDYARSLGKTVSFDANYRPGLWEDAREAHKIIMDCIRHADVVKLSEEEFEAFFSAESMEGCAGKLLAGNAKFVAISLGGRGCFYATRKVTGEHTAPRVNAIDTTGCGDALMGALLQLFCDESIVDRFDCVESNVLGKVVSLAVCAASICAERLGSMECIANREEALESLRLRDSQSRER
ncbi:MAG: carbohydrate kinase [Clostridia bacterium]|nr:carbohydrate kinase [Clostridia bacterium]